jgi:sulfite reductase (ferredoxin)
MTEPKKPNPVENLKENSHFLRGTIKESLSNNDLSHFTGEEGNLLKAHGTYQQDDRDIRQKLLAEKKEPAYSMMVRSKIPGGKMTPEQYLLHDELADKYGNQSMRLTDRQGIQFHGVLKKNAKAVIRSINEKLGTTIGACGDNVRNVMACPAPLPDRLKMDILKYAKAVSDEFLPRGGAYQEIWLDGEKMHLPAPLNEEPIYGKTYLPRKFKFALAFTDDNCTDVYSNDCGIVPEIINGTLTGFNILVGGGFGMTHGVATTYPRAASPLCFVEPEELVAICKAIVLTQRDHGDRTDRKHARMKYLIDDKGLEWFRSEVEQRFGKKTRSAHPIRWKGIHNHLGWQEGAEGKWFLGLYIENGRMADTQKMKLKSGVRDFVAKYRPEVYITAQQDLIFNGFKESQKPEIEAFLKSYGIKFPNELSMLRKDAMACPALPTCGLAITEAERSLPQAIDELEQKVLQLGLESQRIMIRMTGCPNGCARPYNAEIAFVGRTVGTYNVYLGGSQNGDRLNFVAGEKVLEKDLANFVTPYLLLYKGRRLAGETFGDFCARLGQTKLAEAASMQAKA